MTGNRDGRTPEPRAERLAALVRDARARRGWTQDELAATTGVSRPTIMRIESGKSRHVEPDMLRALCSALGIDPRRAAVALGYLDEADATPTEFRDSLGSEVHRAIRGLGAIIGGKRASKGWSVQQLADRSGIPAHRITKIEEGAAWYADPDEIRPLYEALDVPLMQLAGVGQADIDISQETGSRVEQIIELLESPDVPDEAKLAFIDYLRYVRSASRTAASHTQTSSQEFCAAIGKPHPGPMSAEEEAEWERIQDEADADLERRYGRTPGERSAA